MKLQLGSPPSDGDYLDAFIIALKAAEAGDGTVKLYSTAVKDFLDFTKKNPKSVTSEDVNKWIIHLMSKEGKIKGTEMKRARSVTLRNYVIAVRRFLKWIGININPVIPRARRKEIWALSEDDVKRLIDATRRLRDKLIIKLFLDTGLRSKELLSLRVEDIDLKNRMIRVRETKNGEERIVFFTDETEKLLRKYLAKHDNEKLFPMTYQALYKLIKRLGERAGIKGLRPHILRHTFATTAIRKGLPLPAVQRLLGHKDIKTTQIYTHLVLEDLMQAYKKVFDENTT
ncbi:site-specific tyrosine recombinase/integron integrase [Acidianus sp. HS-5]|uniref:site-specific tyrosine recombinase/integron integrase n=1 Tax=Acidianus sp. HS-5 TaxID=2886040 RepID=UPI001F023148|nr:site-specific tyrosine recombinase/integron integrase [Acidianus sp. HS-5]BDC19776.1 recombinase XerD [Acidianus sp. HS-5]